MKRSNFFLLMPFFKCTRVKCMPNETCPLKTLLHSWHLFKNGNSVRYWFFTRAIKLQLLFCLWCKFTWAFKAFSVLLKKLQVSHVNCFFPSWASFLWVFKWLLSIKRELHIPHFIIWEKAVDSKSTICSLFIRALNLLCWVKFSLQKSHINTFFLLWTEARCFFSKLSSEELYTQISHLKILTKTHWRTFELDLIFPICNIGFLK